MEGCDQSREHQAQAQAPVISAVASSLIAPQRVDLGVSRLFLLGLAPNPIAPRETRGSSHPVILQPSSIGLAAFAYGKCH